MRESLSPHVEKRFTSVQLRQRDLQGASLFGNVAQFNLLRRERSPFAHLCVQGVVIQRGKPVYFRLSTRASQIQRVDFYRRDNLFVLFQARPRRLIGIDQTIKTVIVVGIVAVVAAELQFALS